MWAFYYLKQMGKQNRREQIATFDCVSALTLTQSNVAICSLRFLSRYKKMVTIVTQHLSDPVYLPSLLYHLQTLTRIMSSYSSRNDRKLEVQLCFWENYKSSLFASMSVNDKVTICWFTEDGWKGSEQSFKWRCLKPESPELLLVGQKVDVRFNRRWFQSTHFAQMLQNSTVDSR